MPAIRLYLWPHRLLMLGPGFDAGLHRHHAAQLCFGLDGPLRLRTRSNEPWEDHVGFYVPPDRSHEFAAMARTTAVIYVETESAEFAELKNTLRAGESVKPLEAEPEALTQLRTLVRDGGTIEQANAACLFASGLMQGQGRQPALDPRIAQFLRTIRAQLDRPLRLSALATDLHVSQSWLSHRFAEEVGVPMRRYVLWQRLWRAMEIALAGATLTEAAHAAGLSDSAHLSRTFRDTFGVPPSFLFEHRDQLVVHFSDERLKNANREP